VGWGLRQNFHSSKGPIFFQKKTHCICGKAILLVDFQACFKLDTLEPNTIIPFQVQHLTIE
jgi:hypothetical protein